MEWKTGKVEVYALEDREIKGLSITSNLLGWAGDRGQGRGGGLRGLGVLLGGGCFYLNLVFFINSIKSVSSHKWIDPDNC